MLLRARLGSTSSNAPKIAGLILFPACSYYIVYGSLFVYAPNKVAPIVFAVLYGLSAVGHLYQCM